MLEFNVTTPLEKYNKMTGRFGINDESKHVVAEIIYPTGSVGTELLFNVASIADFDVKFSLATPLEFLERILIVGKLKEEEVSQHFDIVSCFYFGLQQPYYKYMLSNSYFKKNSTTVPTILYLFIFFLRQATAGRNQDIKPCIRVFWSPVIHFQILDSFWDTN